MGKSTLFNRLLEERKAIVDDVSGVTRDRQYGVTEWNGKNFNVIDTGGFVPDSSDMFETEIRKQVRIAIDEANCIIFMVDAAVGMTDLDASMADMLRRTTKPVLVVANKVDNSNRALDATEFYSMGFEHNYFVSSISGSGTGEILDAVTNGMKDEPVKVVNAELPEGAEPEEEVAIPKIAIMGQPNVGKSSLLNAMIGQNRTIVSDIAGTTRDTIHTHYNMFQKEFVLVKNLLLRYLVLCFQRQFHKGCFLFLVDFYFYTNALFCYGLQHANLLQIFDIRYGKRATNILFILADRAQRLINTRARYL